MSDEKSSREARPLTRLNQKPNGGGRRVRGTWLGRGTPCAPSGRHETAVPTKAVIIL